MIGNKAMQDLLNKIKQAIINRDSRTIIDLVDEALISGVSPKSLVNEGLVAAMDVVGDQFGKNEIFVPEMLASALLMSNALNKVKPNLIDDDGGGDGKGTIIMCTVKGDLHDIGKNLVTIMLEGAGFTVHDIGVNITSEDVVRKVKEIKPDVLGLSALLTTTMPEMKKVIRMLTEMGIRENIKIMIGGAPVSSKFAEQIGADGYAEDAAQAVVLARRLIQL